MKLETLISGLTRIVTKKSYEAWHALQLAKLEQLFINLKTNKQEG